MIELAFLGKLFKFLIHYESIRSHLVKMFWFFICKRADQQLSFLGKCLHSK